MRWVERIFNLLIVFLLLSATAAATGEIWGYSLATTQLSTSTLSDNHDIVSPSLEQLTALGLPKNCHLTLQDTAIWQVKGNTGKDLGILLHSQRWAKDVQGFAGPTPLLLWINPQHKIQNIIALPNQETEGYFKHALTLLPHWLGVNIKEVEQHQVDAVTGATYSSVALNLNIRKALLGYQQQNIQTNSSPTLGWFKTIAVIFVLFLGVIVALRFKGKKRLRQFVLFLNIIVLGFWTGQFLSVSLLHGWAHNGIPFIHALPTVIMLLVAIILPFVTRNNHYCNWICPYGSLQELGRWLPIRPIRVSPKIYRYMKTLRLCLLMTLLGLLWLGLGADLLNYEPFSAFMVTSAPIIVILLALGFFIAGLFIPRLWCQAICPMGMLLDLIEDRQIKKKKKS